MPVTHLSRSELMQLLYDKASLIRSEAEDIDSESESRLSLADARKRMKRIGIEAKRCAALIESYEMVAKSGHCLHCGKPYSEHHDLTPPLPPGEPRVRFKGEAPAEPQCRALQRFFESLEIETYQGLQIVEVG